jgi:hypothetical protein
LYEGRPLGSTEHSVKWNLKETERNRWQAVGIEVRIFLFILPTEN